MNFKITLSTCLFGIAFQLIAICQINSGRIATELNEAIKNGKSFTNLPLFKAESPAINQSFQKTYSKANYWIQDPNTFTVLNQNSPQYISLELADYQNNTLTLLLEKQELFGPDSRLLTSTDPQHGEALSSGLYYRGIVKEYAGSIAAFSFFADQTIAVLALPERGNLVLGKMKSATKDADSQLPHVLYYENELPQKSNFQCGTDLLPQMPNSNEFIQVPDTIYTSHCKTAKVFLECDYRLYTDYGNSVAQVKNYITGLFNVVKTLYYNELINIEISDMMVWNSPDPFLHTDLASIIYNYAAYRKSNFNGNLAQLVTTYQPQQAGGISFLANLCHSFDGQSGPHSFAYIYNSYSQLPTYSWSVEVMTHEMGHTFGSPHTHACAWGPNHNTTLDNCQPPESNCAYGPAPVNGGTIMSYCHLVSYGINFSNGFGKEPGDLIRSYVQTKTCMSSLFTPTIVANTSGPYYEGDNIILKARPGKSTYSYDWFHYDYLMPTPKDSILRPTYSGIYKSVISVNPCSEYSTPDTVIISDFLVNLGCPVIHGFRDSVEVSLTMDADNKTIRDTLTVPDSLYQKVPAWAKDVLVELHTKITPFGTSWTRDAVIAYQGPTETTINNAKYTPNSSEPAGFNGEKTYVKILGKFNPKGDWYFLTNDIKFDNGLDEKITFSIVISWRKDDSIPPCDIALCDGQSRTFDAGIPGAKYLWSTGETTKTISTNQTGPLSVQVTKGSKKASHSVQLYNYQTHYNQAFITCDGDTIRVGKHFYTKRGTYVDTLTSSNGCDSVITSALEIIPIEKSSETINLCNGERYDSIPYYKDSQLSILLTSAITGCDSIHLINLKVDPAIAIQSVSIPACPEIGGSIEVNASGGSGTVYLYEWQNGRSTKKLDSLQSGTYQVKAIDSSGCIMKQDVELKNLDSVGIAPLVFDVSCFGKEDGKIFVDFNSGAFPFTIVWSSGETDTKQLANLKAGKYTIFVRDINGCRNKKEIEVHSPELLTVQLDIKESTGNDGSAKTIVNGGTAPYNYFWSTGETTAEINGLAPGNYWVFVHDVNGCETRYDFVVQQVVATNQSNQNESITIFPIPVKERLIVSLETTNQQHQIAWKMYDVHSRISNEGIFNSKDKLHSIDVSMMQTGVYILELRMQGNEVFRKVILKE